MASLSDTKFVMNNMIVNLVWNDFLDMAKYVHVRRFSGNNHEFSDKLAEQKCFFNAISMLSLALTCKDFFSTLNDMYKAREVKSQKVWKEIIAGFDPETSVPPYWNTLRRYGMPFSSCTHCRGESPPSYTPLLVAMAQHFLIKFLRDKTSYCIEGWWAKYKMELGSDMDAVRILLDPDFLVMMKNWDPYPERVRGGGETNFSEFFWLKFM